MSKREEQRYRLKIYLTELNNLKAMSDEDYREIWVRNATLETEYESRLSLISFLEACVLSEVNRLFNGEAA